MNKSKKHLLFIYILFIVSISNAQYKYDNIEYKWKKVSDFKGQAGLPDPFLKPDGKRIQTKDEWPKQKKYIIAMLEHYQYGTMPPVPKNMDVQETHSENLFSGKATKKLYTIKINRNEKQIDLHFCIIKPKGKGPFPIIVKNYAPNPMNRDMRKFQIDGIGISKESLIEVLDRGYIYCVYNREDLGSDIGREFDKNRNNGVFPMYPEYNWGTIAAWAWGYRLIIDYFETVDFIDMDKIVATGHSRGGKTAICGGVFDTRIAVTAPNSSGLGGSSSFVYDELLSPGEPNQPPQTISIHKARNPHWWSEEYYKLAGYESKTPFDAHFNKIVIAPRAFFNTHAYQDYHANPLGAWLTSEAAKKVYKWLGAEKNIAMHYRTGGHAQSIIDWFALLDFCDQYFYNKPPSSPYNIKYNFNKVNPYPWAKIPVIWDIPDK